MKHKKIPRLLALVLALLLMALNLQGLQPGASARDTSQSDWETVQTEAAALAAQNGAYRPNSLYVFVGYFGGPYVPKQRFTVSDNTLTPTLGNNANTDISSMFQEVTYTMVDNADNVNIEKARVLTLEDLMAASNIDKGSVQFLHVRTGDDHSPSKTWSELTETRYCFEQLLGTDASGVYYTTTAEDNFETDRELIDNSAVAVPAGVAIQDNFHPAGREGNMTTENAVRLVFGQTAATEQNAGDAMKWCYAIYVQLGGTPKATVTTIEEVQNDTTGSTYHVTVNVSTIMDNGMAEETDADVAAQIAAGLRLSSGDRNTADPGGDDSGAAGEYDPESGTVTFTVHASNDGSGTTQLHINTADGGYGGEMEGKEFSFNVVNNGGKLELPDQSDNPNLADGLTITAKDPDTEPDPDPDPSDPNGPTSPDPGPSDPSSPGQTDPNPSGGQTSITPDTPNSNQNVQSPNETGEQVTPKPQDAQESPTQNTSVDTENAPKVNSIRVHKLTIDSNEGAEQNWRDKQMAENAVELAKLDENNEMLPIVLIAALALLVLSMLLRYLQYINELGEPA